MGLLVFAAQLSEWLHGWALPACINTFSIPSQPDAQYSTLDMCL